MKKEKLKNSLTIKSIRYGHANNSSSSHSFVFLGETMVEDNWYGDGFGWEYFTLSSRKLKSFYFLNFLCDKLEDDYTHSLRKVLIEKNQNTNKSISEEQKKGTDESNQLIQATQKFNYAKKIIKKEFSDVFDQEALEEFIEERIKKIGEYFSKFYTDHQSYLYLPVDKKGFTGVVFLKQFFKVLMDNNFVILGGNDNSDKHHENYSKHIENPFSKKVMQVLTKIQNKIIKNLDQKTK